MLSILAAAFRDEKFAEFSLNDFSDHTVAPVYAQVTSEFSEDETDRNKPSKPQQLIDEARHARGTTNRSDRIRAACIYLRHAQLLGENPAATHPQKPTAAESFHNAANEFRTLDLQDRAAQCYFNSGVAALNSSRTIGHTVEQARAPLALALRSAGRAKALYTALGDEERSGRAHQLRKEIQRRWLQLDKNPEWLLLYVWKVVTGYGTSSGRWFATLTVTLITFTVLYGASLELKLLELDTARHYPVVTWFYLSALNLLQFGSYTQIAPIHWSVQLLLVLHGVAAFVLMGTAVTFLTRK